MAEIILFTNSQDNKHFFEDILSTEKHSILDVSDIDECMKMLYSQNIDGIIIDYKANVDLQVLARKIKVVGKTKLPFILLYAPIDYENELLFRYIDGFLPQNAAKPQLVAMLRSALRIEKNVNELTKNNSELAKNIYQLDVLYNTSSGFASTLNKKKLISLMIQSVQRSISPTFISVYIKETNTVFLCANRKPTYRLEEALKLRAVLNYKEIFQDNDIDLNTLKIDRNYKEEFSEIDLQLFNYDNILSLITLSDNNYGFIEVFKEADFTQEDVTCLQTILKQVSSPLENAILYQEIKDTNTKLEKLERLKSDFISIVSHELRTPLTPIKNSLDIILKGLTGEVSAQTKKFVDMAKRNVDRLSEIINDLLDLSKVEAGKMDFKFEKKSILPAIEYVKNTFEQTAKNKGINLSLNIKEELPDLYIDSKRIEQIISNIVSNAIKFTPDNGNVEISCEKTTLSELLKLDFYEQILNESYQDYVKISIKDSGIGIEQENISKIFDKFQQIENSLSREVGGTGLGLPIAKQLTQAHQGVIWLESELNKGTCFFIAIPILNSMQIFKTELNRALCNSKQFKKSLSIIKLNEKSDNELINAITNDNLSIVKKSGMFKELTYNEDDENNYICFMQDVDESSMEFLINKIKDYTKTNLTEDRQNDIMYSKVIYPNDGLTTETLLNKLQTTIKNIKE